MLDYDVAEKLLEDYNDVFADIVNTLLFDGNERVKEDSLEDSKINSAYKAEDGKLHEQERDVSKYWKEGNTNTMELLTEVSYLKIPVGLQRKNLPL